MARPKIVIAMIVLCDGDGVTSSDLRLFDYRNRRRPLYPFEADLDLVGART